MIWKMNVDLVQKIWEIKIVRNSYINKESDELVTSPNNIKKILVKITVSFDEINEKTDFWYLPHKISKKFSANQKVDYKMRLLKLHQSFSVKYKIHCL